jgi:tetratricopeptide (TPR) repeat protein
LTPREADPEVLIASAQQAAEALRLAGRWEAGAGLLLATRPYARGLGPSVEGRVLTAVNRIENDRALFTGSPPLPERRALLDEAAELGRRVGDLVLRAEALDRLGTSLHVEALTKGSRPPAGELACFEEALALAVEAGDANGAARTTFHIGRYHQEGLGDAEMAGPCLEEARQAATRLDDRILLSYAIRHLALIVLAAGDLASARAGLEQSLQLREEVGFIPAAAIARVTLADVLTQLGERDQAADLVAQARASLRPLGVDVR